MCILKRMCMLMHMHIDMCICMYRQEYYLHPSTHARWALKSSFCVVCLVFFVESFSLRSELFNDMWYA